MPFNIDKCKVLHVGFNNNKEKYVLDSCDLSAVSDEKDLGVIVSSDLKMSKQCKKASSTANKVLGMINRTITTKKSWILLPLYKSLVRPHLDYCVQAWRPYVQKDIDLLEKVQKRATRMCIDLKKKIITKD